METGKSINVLFYLIMSNNSPLFLSLFKVVTDLGFSILKFFTV